MQIKLNSFGKITLFNIAMILAVVMLLSLRSVDSQSKPPKDPEGVCKCPINEPHDNDCKNKKTKDECVKSFCTQSMYCGAGSPQEPGKDKPDDDGKNKYRCEWHVPCMKCEDLPEFKAKAKDGWFITADCPTESNACESKVCNIAKDTDGDGKSDKTDSIDCKTKPSK